MLYDKMSVIDYYYFHEERKCNVIASVCSLCEKVFDRFSWNFVELRTTPVERKKNPFNFDSQFWLGYLWEYLYKSILENSRFKSPNGCFVYQATSMPPYTPLFPYLNNLVYESKMLV